MRGLRGCLVFFLNFKSPSCPSSVGAPHLFLSDGLASYFTLGLAPQRIRHLFSPDTKEEGDLRP